MQDAAAHGKDISKMKLHECKCPPCFKAGTNLRGQLTCSPTCDLGDCDLKTGACSSGGSGGDEPSFCTSEHVVASFSGKTLCPVGLVQQQGAKV